MFQTNYADLWQNAENMDILKHVTFIKILELLIPKKKNRECVFSVDFYNTEVRHKNDVNIQKYMCNKWQVTTLDSFKGFFFCFH
jgi:ribonuclease HIII